MIVLQAFVDDSASEVGDKRLYLAGYINSVDRWISFSNAWDQALLSDPAIAYCRMAEAQSRRGQFENWSKEAAGKKIISLARVIESHRPWSVHCSVSRAEYASIVAPGAPYPAKNPYFACFWGIIELTAKYHRSLGSEDIPPVDFIFDDQLGLEDLAIVWYRLAKSEMPPEHRALLGATPIFRDDKMVVPLQAADMLAWNLRRNRERGGLEKLPAFDFLVRDGLHAMRDLESRDLRRMARGMRLVPGVSLIQTKSSWRGIKNAAILAAKAAPPRINLLRMWINYASLRARHLLRWLFRHRR